MDLEKPERVHKHPTDRFGLGRLPASAPDAGRNPFIDSVLWLIVIAYWTVRDWVETLWIKITNW